MSRALEAHANTEISRLLADTRELISITIKRLIDDDSWRTELSEAGCRPSHAERLYDVLIRVKEHYAASFDRMCEMLNPTPTTAYPKFSEIVNQLFQSGINWGRIATMVAFGVHLAVYFQNNHMENMVPSVIGWIQRVAETNLLAWLHQHGGWEGFYQHYSNVSRSSDGTRGGGTSWAKVGLWTAAVGAIVYLTC